MKYRSKLEPAVLFSLGVLILPTLAQNNTDSSRCHYPSPDAPINSTGTQAFRWGGDSQDWYFTLTLNNTHAPGYEEQDFGGWISAPENINASVCHYIYEGLDVAAGSGDGGCDGVLSTECRNFIVSDMLRRREMIRYLPGHNQCVPPTDSEELDENCGKELRYIGGSANSDPLYGSSCNISSPPGEINVQRPGYVTTSTTSPGGGRSNGAGNYESYDRYVRQVRPWIITRQDTQEDQLQVQVLCMAPNQVVEGSRKPEGEWPPSAAGRKTVEVEMLLIVVAAAAWVW